MRCGLLVLLSVGVLGCAADFPAAADSADAYTSPAAEAGANEASARVRDQLEAVSELAAAPRAQAPTPKDQPLAAPAVEQVDPQVLKRQVIYSASLRLVVVSTSEAFSSITAIASQAGGYMQESTATSITIRVPAAQFEPTMSRLATLGEVVDRSVKASDVTEQMIELNLRIDNARKTRERLVAHLAKSERMEDTLKIEAELARVTGEIELMEGKLRLMQSQVAMSTIRVELNSNAPRQTSTDRLGLPFAWVEKLGGGLIAGSVEAMPRQPRFLSGGPKFQPPGGFVRYFSSDTLVEAMNAEGLRIKVQRHDNYDRGDLSFWKPVARKSLVQGRSLAINGERDLGDDRTLFTGTRDVGGQPYGYLLMLSRDRDHVFAFEAWGPKGEFDRQVEALTSSAMSLRR